MSKAYTLIFSFLIIYYFVITPSKAQLISDDRKAEWSIVGIQPSSERVISGSPIKPLGEVGMDDNVYDLVKEFGADNKGIRDISDILQRALDTTPPASVIYFPTGVYLIKKNIRVPDDKILRGRSPNTTFLHFDLGGKNQDLFSVIGISQKNYVEVAKMGKKGGYRAEIFDASGFNIGDDVELEQENNPAIYTNPLWDQEWAQWAVGQLLQIDKKEGNHLRFDRSFSIDYDNDFLIRLHKVNLTKNVGFERFTIERLDNGRGNNFRFYYAANTWIKCVHSKKASRSHVRIEKSRNCSVTGSFFEDAHYHCGSGSGYGINCLDHTSDCLIENNIFKRLRHSMMVKEGANRNVFAYNYSFETLGTLGTAANEEGCIEDKQYSPSADISLHGHYPSMNLFEHNIVEQITVADYWGPAGPGNTIFRNMVTANTIEIDDFSANQNIIANRVINVPIYVNQSVLGTLLVDNQEGIYGSSQTSYNIPDSYYLLEKPKFYDKEPWPAIGPEYTFKYATIPALERWDSNKIFDKKCCGDVEGLNSMITFYNDLIVFFELNNLFIEYSNSNLLDVYISDMQGKIVYQAQKISANNPIPIGHDFSNGMYIINLFDNQNNTRSVVKILKM